MNERIQLPQLIAINSSRLQQDTAHAAHEKSIFENHQKKKTQATFFC